MGLAFTTTPMRQWLDEGLITFRFDETNGVEKTSTLDAIHKDVHGRQYGQWAEINPAVISCRSR